MFIVAMKPTCIRAASLVIVCAGLGANSTANAQQASAVAARLEQLRHALRPSCERLIAQIATQKEAPSCRDDGYHRSHGSDRNRTAALREGSCGVPETSSPACPHSRTTLHRLPPDGPECRYLRDSSRLARPVEEDGNTRRQGNVRSKPESLEGLLDAR